MEANGQYAHVRFPTGREDTVSVRDLSPPATKVVVPVISENGVESEIGPENGAESNVEPDILDVEADNISVGVGATEPTLRRSTQTKQSPARLTY